MHVTIRNLVSAAYSVGILAVAAACSSDPVAGPLAVSSNPSALRPPQAAHMTTYVSGTVQGWWGGNSWRGQSSITASAEAPSARTLEYTSVSSCISCQWGTTVWVQMEVYNNGDGVLTDRLSGSNGGMFTYDYASKQYAASGAAVYRYVRGEHTIQNFSGGSAIYSYASGHM